MIGKNWKKKKNSTIALNVLYAKKERIYPAYISKYNFLNCEKKSYSFNHSKWRRMALSCSKKTISVIGRYNA